MRKVLVKKYRYKRRKLRVGSKVFGTAKIPRLSVFRSINHIYAQLVDDGKQITLVSASDNSAKSSEKKTDRAYKVGEELAKKALAKKIKKVIFDRNGFSYHGRIKAVAEGARKGGLEF